MGHVRDRGKEVEDEPIYRARRSDIMSCISIGSLIAAVSLMYAIFHNFTLDLHRSIESFEIHVSRQLDRFDDRIREIERRK